MGDLDDQLRRLADQRAARTPETSATTAMAAGSSGGRPSPAWWLAAAAMLAVLAGAGAWLVGNQETADTDPAITTTTTSLAPTTTVAPTEPLQQLRALAFGVAVEAPADWVETEPGQTWAGDSGFVAVDVAPQGTLEEAASVAIQQAGAITGGFASQTLPTINGQPAITIVGNGVFESDHGEFQHAFTIITAPNPVEDRDELWPHIVVASDAEHHDAILASLEWITAPSGSHLVQLHDYGLEFSLPDDWQRDGSAGYQWSGENGRLGIDAQGTADLDAATDNSANHRLRPYGDEPIIEERIVDGQPARLILPDPAGAPEDVAEFVITPPERVVIRGSVYGTIKIYADPDIIESIVSTIRWIETDPPNRVEISSPDPAISYDIVAGTSVGIELRHADNPDRVDVIDDLGAVDLAFLVGGKLVYQPEDEFGDPISEIRLENLGGWQPLDLGEGRLRLLDAKVVDGSPMALVTRRVGETPETAQEDMLLVDLTTESVATTITTGGWESGVADARMGDGAIALLASAEGFTWLIAIDYDGNELWTHAEEFDGPQGVVLTRDVVFASWVEPATSTVTLAPFDLRTGVARGETVVQRFDGINDPDFQSGDCARIVWSPYLCGRRDGQPIHLDFETGTADSLTSLAGGTPTIVDAIASATLPPLGECGEHNAWTPDTTVVDVRQLNPTTLLQLAVFEGDDGFLYLQGQVDDRYTLPVSLEPFTTAALDMLQITGEGGGLAVLFNDSPSEDFVSGPSYALAFDGCDLILGLRSIIN